MFQGLGNLGEPYTIKLQQNSTPFALNTRRAIPLPLLSRVQAELTKMEHKRWFQKSTSQHHGAQEWLLYLRSAIRICVDLKCLNQNVLREVHPLPKVDNTLAQLSGATIFGKLDANSGFWQILISAKSCLLTTFITPFGHFCFNKLPFGISSTPEHFQKRMSNILNGLDGVV